ncbi:metallophosphoesterase [Eoetvoesiella caeni]|uniref:Serine/threonine protein phosphatase 1 n=1 Tax=Eoetvoesiella caeni TaxID=645616 RepID=A0A366GXV2_9BURK|nr:metallophosphoesterase [Eoetvoesiella caeni]MCI2811344.1 metallophosphoesterase [Eoetvoesiella caeni]NYT57229.1 metallophosphoesterase [Eoetvoesiella caeni]RBP33576.1 serine/threonine protein phosphatase 1 [Eoetvoesiella caeni]
MTTFHQHLPANTVGRDFIVGDLHGCLDLLHAELARLQFEPAKDRLFSVGDLADRGPDSMGCLRLLREPWFHAVRGNHEDMLIAYVYPVVQPYAFDDPAKIFFQNGGRWVLGLDTETEAELMHDLLPRVVALPYVITVGEGASQFHVAHAELMTGRVEEGDIWSTLAGSPVDQSPKRVLTDDLLTDEVLSGMVEPLTWGRRLVGQVKVKECTVIDTPAGKLLVSQQPMHPGLSLTYVGHTPLAYMVLHESHFFIDRGAYDRGPDTCLLVLCLGEEQEWLV